MEKFLTIISICFCYCFSSFAQTLPILEEGKIWYGETWAYGLELSSTSERKVCGDSVVNGVSYKKIYLTTNFIEYEEPIITEEVFLAREENGVMYYYIGNKEFCFFDFNRKIGDTFLFEYDTSLLESEGIEVYGVVEDITTIETADGNTRKVYHVKCYTKEVEDGDFSDDIWGEYMFIEGIGEARYGISFRYGVLMTGGGVPKLICVHDVDGNHLYGGGDNQECIISCVGAPKVQQGYNWIYDLQGCKRNSIPMRGIYIRNGKKYISK